MKIAAKAILPLLFVGTAYAATDAQVYRGFAAGNPELATEYESASVDYGAYAGSFDAYVYHGWQVGNPELSFDQESGVMRTATQQGIGDSLAGDRGMTTISNNDIYHGFERGNPELN